MTHPATATPAPTAPLRIALLGTGLMGLPMGQRLCQAGHEVHVWNRTATKATPLVQQGATLHPTPRAACAKADIVLCMLENGPVTQQVLFGTQPSVGADINEGVSHNPGNRTDSDTIAFTHSASAALRPGMLVVDMASIQPAEARDHAARLATLGVRHLDAPVSGGTVGAAAGTLAIMAGGDEADFAAAQPLFAPLGRATHVGPHGAGQLTKLANQMIVGITIGAVAEALLLCARGGADPAKVREAITGGFADSRILQLHGQRMVQRTFTPGARMTVQHKDLHNALVTAGHTGTQLPITELLHRLYASGIEHGFGALDHSGLLMELERLNQHPTAPDSAPALPPQG